MTRQYQYKALVIGKHRAEATMNEYGRQGWRVIAFIVDDNANARILLERETA